MATTVLVCRCGMRMNAPNAVPGRKGKCPSCGAVVLVPGVGTEPGAGSAQGPGPGPAAPAAGPAVRKPSPSPIQQAAPGGEYAVADVAPPRTPVLGAPRIYAPPPVKRARKPKNWVERLEAWDGIVPAPSRPEGFWRSLVYPLWGWTGLVFLAVLPVIWWFLSLPLFGYLHMITNGEAVGMAPARALVPSIMGLIVVFGYTLLFLSQVLTSGAMGEVRHPRPPEAELWEIVRGLLQWAWALFCGAVIGGVPIYLFLGVCEEPEPADWALVAGLAALGGAYSLMALLVTLLFEDPLAANPVTVLRAMAGMGMAYLRPCLLGAAAAGLALFLLGVVLSIPDAILALAGLWFFWAFSLYESIVVMRVLGLEYHGKADRLGWFRDPAHARD